MSGRNIRLSRIHPTTGFLAVEGAIETDGRFGIGSDNPQANLHVEGNAYVTSDLDVHGDVDIKGNFKQNGVGLNFLFGATPWSNLQDDSNIYYTGGKVSIGAITPDATLHVEGDTYVSSNLEVGQANLFVDTTSSRVGVGTATPQAIFHVEGNTYMSSNLEVGQANLFVDTQTSRVGVGTTEPDATLHVEGNVYVSSNLEVGQANLFVDTQTSRVGVGTTEPAAVLHVEGNTHVSSNLEVGQANLFVDTQTSMIGLGTTEPGATLHVEGNVYVSSNLEVGQANLFVDTQTSRVGVGTTEPAAILHVEGNTHVSSNLEVGQANLFVDTQTSRVGVGTTEPTAVLHVEGNTHVSSNLEVGQANLFVDTQTSMIGVRTNVPNFNLDVNGDINFTGEFYQNGVLFTRIIGATPWSNLQDDSNIYYTGGKVSIGSITPDATLHVEGDTYVSSNLEVGQANLFVDTTSSRVGVGTATPQANLHVDGNTYVSSNLEVGQANLFVDTQTSRVGVGTTEPDATLHVDGNAYVSSNLEVGQANLFVDTQTSKIGVGTTEPDATLHVEGNAYVSSNLEVGQANLFVDTQTSKIGVGTTEPDATLHVEGNAYVSSNLEVGQANLFVDTTSSRVGVGTATPQANFHVVGNAYVSSNLEVAKELTVSGNVNITNELNVGGHSQVSNATISTTTTDYSVFHWCLRASGDPETDTTQGKGTCITNDGTGNVYVTGTFDEDATLHDKDDIERGSITNPRKQPFIIKYSYSGDIQWYTYVGSPTDDVYSHDGALDTDGNYYITGIWFGTEVNFYNEDGTVGDTITYNAYSGTKGYLVKYNASGYVQWSILFVGNGPTGHPSPYVRMYRVDADAENIYVVGQFGHTNTTLDLYNASSSSVADTLTNTAGGAETFIAQYDSSGFLQWRARLGGSGAQYSSLSGLSIDNTGNVYVTATYSGALAIYNADDNQAATFNSSGTDAYIAKYNSSGVHQWSTGLSGSGSDRGYSLTTTNDGAVYVSGSYTSSPMIFYDKDGSQSGTLIHSSTTMTGASSTNEDGFIAKYNSSGFLQWCTRIEGRSREQVEDITVDNTGNVYITGAVYSNVVNFYNKDDTVADTSSFTSFDHRGYIAKYDSNGYFLWHQLVIGEGIYKISRPNSIVVGNDDNVYFTGTYGTDLLEFYNNGIRAAALGLTDNFDKYRGMFVARYGGFGKTIIINSKTTYDSIALNTSGGNIGIGTNAPMCTLDVNGDINFSGRITGPGFTTRKFRGGPLKEPSYYSYNEIYTGIEINESSVGTVYYSVKSQTNSSRSHGSFDYAIIIDSGNTIVDWSTKAVAHLAHTNTNMHIIAKLSPSGSYNTRIYLIDDSGGTTSPDNYDWELVIVKYTPFTH
jgi:sugar lactone lactonase YvrE